MVSIALVVFREVFEIALIVGILMAATKGLPKRTRWVWFGLLLGTVGAGIIAFFADSISQAAEGMGQEMFNAAILLVAAVLIGWTTLWMTRHGRQVTQEFKQIGRELSKGNQPIYSLAVVVALAVLREGAEVVMFTYSAFVTGETVPHLMMGGLLGAGAGALAGILLYYGLTKVHTGKIFTVISWLLIFLVAGMVVQAFGYLTAAGKVPEIIPAVWDTSGIIARGSLFGQVLHALVGYTDRPSGVQIVVYLITIGGFAMALNLYGQVNVPAVKKALIAVLFGVVCLVSMPQEAHATKKVYSPIVEKGEWEIEARGQYDIDERAEKDNVQKQKYSVGYGVTDRWFTEVYGEWEREKIDEDENGEPENLKTKFTSMSWENRFQLTEQGKYPVDVGVYVEYEAAFEDKHPDNIETKLLLEKSLANFTHTMNITLEQKIGRNTREDLVGGLAWSSRYRLTPWFAPGVEWHSDLGELSQRVPYQEQEHQLGPVFYGKVGHMKYDVGYLFGMSDAAPKGEIKWIAEYEFRF